MSCASRASRYDARRIEGFEGVFRSNAFQIICFQCWNTILTTRWCVSTLFAPFILNLTESKKVFRELSLSKDECEVWKRFQRCCGYASMVSDGKFVFFAFRHACDNDRELVKEWKIILSVSRVVLVDKTDCGSSSSSPNRRMIYWLSIPSSHLFRCISCRICTFLNANKKIENPRRQQNSFRIH